MDKKRKNIDYSDIPEITDFTNARKNPHAESIRKYGYSITVHYSPEDVADMLKQSVAHIDSMEDMGWLDLDPEEIAALKRYRDANGGAR